MSSIDLASIPSWKIEDNKLNRQFTFSSFRKAMLFMQEIADYCEHVDHHPLWQNSYRNIEVWLWTHDTGSITAKDVTLAEKMDDVADRLA